MAPLKVGDLCITQNARSSTRNNGLSVVIIAIDHTQFDGATPYLIRRVDRQPIPVSISSDGVPQLFTRPTAWCAGYKLRRVGVNNCLPEGALPTVRLGGPPTEDEVTEYLRRAGLPLTRANYLAVSMPDGTPQEMEEAALEMEFPTCLTN